MKTKRHSFSVVHTLMALALNLAVNQQANAGSFFPTGTLNIARAFHTATLLTNGQALIVGGSGTNSVLASADLYVPGSATWMVTNALNIGRYSHTATLLANGQVLVAGGTGTNSVLSSTELYDPVSRNWTVTGSMTNARIYHTATLLTNGRVLVVGGLGSGISGILSSAELYDPASGKWTATGGLNTARKYHTATLLTNGLVLVTGGYGTNEYLPSAELYDPASGTWTTTGTLGTGRREHTATLLTNGLVLVAGGIAFGGLPTSAELYDTVSGMWTTTGAMNIGRFEHAATLLANGQVLVTGGNGTNNAVSSAELYDPVSRTWTVTGGLSTARDFQTATLLPSGQVLVAGGTGIGIVFLASAELYYPALGALRVSLSPAGAISAGAQWQVDGGAFQNSGAVVSNLLAANHTVSFKTISGWFTPVYQTVAVASGVTNTATGTYTPNVGALQITINPTCAEENGAQWQVDGGALQKSGAVVTNLAGGNHTVSFSTIVGWIAPSNQTVLVTVNSTNHSFGNYIETSTPGFITWINVGGAGNWSSPTNWDLNRAPNTNDMVLIPQTGGNFCLLDVNAEVAGLVIGDCDGVGSDGLNLNGHILEVDGPITVKSNAIFGVNSGTLIGTSNTVISGVIGWTSGTLGGTLTLASNGVLNISAATANHNLGGCVFTNYGTVNWSGDQLNGGNGTVIHNYGLWNALDDQNFDGAGTVFNNYGAFRKSGGTGAYPGTLFASGGPSGGGVLFNQAGGVLDVQNGTNGLELVLQGGANFTGGYVTTNRNGFTYLSIGNFTINGATTCSNVAMGGTSLVGTNVIKGGLTWQNGSWNNTVVTVSSNSVLTINSGNPKNISGCRITNYGAVTWSGEGLNGDGGTVVYNYGSWNAQDNQNFAGSGAVFNNYGTFLKSGGTAGYPGTYFTGGGIGNNTTVFNQAGGVLSVQTGDVTLGGTYSLTNGTLNFGINSATNYGVLLLGGVTLGGALSANVSGSFAPAVGEQFGVIGSSALSGTFSSVTVPVGIAVVYTNNSVVLIVTGPVPVQILYPQLVSTNFLFQFPTVSGQSYTIQRDDVLTSTNWVFYTNIIGSGSMIQFQVPVTGSLGQRYFRVRQP